MTVPETSQDHGNMTGGTAASPSALSARGRAPSRVEGDALGGTAASPSALSARGRAPSQKNPVHPLPQRHHPNHLPNIERDNTPVILYVTVCTKDRRPILASEQVHNVLKSVWPKAQQYHVGRYIIMPDHIHFFCAPAVREAENVADWVGYWKRLASQQLKELGELWQRDCWDTQLRSGDSYSEKWDYVRQNPVRKSFVARVEDWPYQGCLNELRW